MIRVINGKASVGYRLTSNELWLSPMTRFRTIPFESYVDLDARKVYTMQHGVSATVRGSVTWRRIDANDRSLAVCALTAFKPDESVYYATGFNCMEPWLADEEFTVDYFSTEETTRDAAGAMVMFTNAVDLPLVRARGGELVISSEAVPQPTALRIPNGGSATVGIGPRHPWAFFGTNLHLTNASNLGYGYPTWGFMGAAGEVRHTVVESGTYWWLFDAQGKGAGHGTLAATWTQRLKLEPGYRMVIRNDTFSVAGRKSTGELEMRYGAESDRTPPTITSLRILDARGRSTERVANGEAASLHLAYADLRELGVGNLRTMTMRTEKTPHRCFTPRGP
jgi:hypothetical protein